MIFQASHPGSTDATYLLTPQVTKKGAKKPAGKKAAPPPPPPEDSDEEEDDDSEEEEVKVREGGEGGCG